MHYHDPARPRSAGGLPQFIHPGWGVIPCWEVRFGIEPGETPQYKLEISAWFLTTPTSASRRSIIVPLGDLDSMAICWLADPEKVAVDWFSYSGPRAAELIPTPSGTGAGISLEDLDL